MKKIGNFPDLLSDLPGKIFPIRVQFSDAARHQDAGRRLAGAGRAGGGRRGRAAGGLAPGQRSGRGPRDQGQVGHTLTVIINYLPILSCIHIFFSLK